MIYLDALVVKVRDGAHVRIKAAHIAVGVDLEGVKHVLGIWVQTSEDATFWAGVCAEPANRGVRDVLIVCCNGAQRVRRGDRGGAWAAVLVASAIAGSLSSTIARSVEPG